MLDPSANKGFWKFLKCLMFFPCFCRRLLEVFDVVNTLKRQKGTCQATAKTHGSFLGIASIRVHESVS